MDNVSPLFNMIKDLERRVEDKERQGETLKAGDGDGTSGGMTDDWKADVERQLGQLHGDVRALLYGLIGGVLFLIAGGATAYVGIAGQITESRKDLTAIQIQQAKTEAKIDLLVERSAPLAK